MYAAFSSPCYAVNAAACIVRSSQANPNFSSQSCSRSYAISSYQELSTKASPQMHQHICDIIQRQTELSSLAAAMNKDAAPRNAGFDYNSSYDLEEAYQGCRKICAQDSKTFYLGTLLMTKARRRAIWAIYVWCRRIDDLVDGSSGANNLISRAVLDEHEARLEDIFSGRPPHNKLDAAFADTISKFPLDIKPFKEMIEGMRMDTYKNRYANFQELSLYCYYAAGTVALMGMPVLGIAQESPLSAEKIYTSALSFAIASQLTNILRDVAEDAERGRVYLPQDELTQFGLSDKDVFARRVTNSWREFIKHQIKRARFYFQLAEEGASQLDKASRWPQVWSTMMMCRMILDEIENNKYDNLTKRASVGWTKRLLALPLAYVRAHHFGPPMFASLLPKD